MLVTGEAKRRGRQQSDEERQPQPEKNPVPWIQKYLDLADMVIHRARYKSTPEQSDPSQQRGSDAVRSPE